MINQNYVVVVKGVILNKGNVLIIKRSQNVHFGGGTWELVGGKIGFGENLEMALIREIKEEAGLDVTVDKILYATTIIDTSRQLVILTYLCRSLENHVELSDEHTDYKWATKSQLNQLLPKNIIENFERYRVFSIKEIL